MKIVETFDTIQGEGKHAGTPVHLIRLYGCNLRCSYCDSTHAYTNDFTEISPRELFGRIHGTKVYTILWTGGEPTLQLDEIIGTKRIMGYRYEHHIETNCTNLDPRLAEFDYVSFSPKDIESLRAARSFGIRELVAEESPFKRYDLKVVTDLKDVGMDMIYSASMLMPLTTGNPKEDLEIKKRVWEYCVQNGVHFSPRIHIGVE